MKLDSPAPNNSIVGTGVKLFSATRTSWYLFLASKECKRPKHPKNGETFGSDFSVGKRVRYTCDTGFVLQGASEIRCLNNRTWSGRVPTCKGKRIINDCTHRHTHTLYFSNSLIIHTLVKYSLMRRTSKSLLDVWRCGKTQSFVLDTLHMNISCCSFGDQCS